MAITSVPWRAHFYLYINGRLQPKYRHHFEDILAFQLAIRRLGLCTGGGTFTDNDKRIASCDIDFEVFADVENHTQQFLEIVNEYLKLPRGLRLKIYFADNQSHEASDQTIKVGEYDIFAIGLDSCDLADQVYEQHSLK